MKSLFSVLSGFVCCASFMASHLLVLNTNAQQPPPARQGGQAPQGNQLGNLIGGQQGGQGMFGGGQVAGAEGGGAQADFDSLIELIQSTVSSETWAENGTGEGEIQPFPTGVYADANGTLRLSTVSRLSKNTGLSTTSVSLNTISKRPAAHLAGDVRQRSALRFVSLPRLEATIRERQTQRQPLSAEMLTLAGLQRIQYVFVVPPAGDDGDLQGDLVIAGPAGNWQVRPDGKIVAAETGQPVVRLDDLLTLWRRQQQRRGAAFGVSINPRQAGLAEVAKLCSRK